MYFNELVFFCFSHYKTYLIKITGRIKDKGIQQLHDAFGAELVVCLSASHVGERRLQLKEGKVN